jgi:hypothetical protein
MTNCSCCRNLEKPNKPCNPHLHISPPHWPGLDYKVSLAARLIYCKDDLAILFIYISTYYLDLVFAVATAAPPSCGRLLAFSSYEAPSFASYRCSEPLSFGLFPKMPV